MLRLETGRAGDQDWGAPRKLRRSYCGARPVARPEHTRAVERKPLGRLAGRHVDLEPRAPGAAALLEPGAVGAASGADRPNRVGESRIGRGRRATPPRDCLVVQRAFQGVERGMERRAGRALHPLAVPAAVGHALVEEPLGGFPKRPLSSHAPLARVNALMQQSTSPPQYGRSSYSQRLFAASRSAVPASAAAWRPHSPSVLSAHVVAVHGCPAPSAASKPEKSKPFGKLRPARPLAVGILQHKQPRPNPSVAMRARVAF